jgi:hypothetical protein
MSSGDPIEKLLMFSTTPAIILSAMEAGRYMRDAAEHFCP